uniref:Coiled-coil domain-containing protein n=1 Tax=Angiostrongylus cantonensis TaxID=6313 RepID=A0A0K0D4L3_ANGCA
MADDLLSERTKKRKMRKSTATASRENGSSCDKPNPNSAFLQWFSDNFSKDTFRNEPDRCMEQIYDTISEQLRRAQATIGLMRDMDSQLDRLNRQLGFLNMKCRSYYNRIAFNKELREQWVLLT